MWALRPYQTEYLVDSKDGSLMFSFTKNPSKELSPDESLEHRMYFAKGELHLVREIIDGKINDNPDNDAFLFELRRFDMLKNLFSYMPPYIYD